MPACLLGYLTESNNLLYQTLQKSRIYHLLALRQRLLLSLYAVNFDQRSTDFVLKGLGAASMLSAPLSDESIIFNSVLEEICSLPAHTVSHIPRSVTPLFATVLAAELYNADIHGIWGFVRFSMLAKCVLRCPPREKKKKRVVISSLLSSRLQR